MLLDKTERFNSVAGLDDRIAPGFQKLARHLANIALVFGEQNRLVSARRFRKRRRSINTVHRLIYARKINLEGRTPSQFAIDPNKSAALLDHAINGGQTQACAFALRLGGEKRLEN